MPETKWSCAQCGKCCQEAVIFNTRQKDAISARYPGLKWIHAMDAEGDSFYYEAKSFALGKCQFLRPTVDGKYECDVYDLRGPVCHAFGDHEYVLYVCHTNPRFDPDEYEEENMLVDMRNPDALAWYNHVNETILGKYK